MKLPCVAQYPGDMWAFGVVTVSLAAADSTPAGHGARWYGESKENSNPPAGSRKSADWGCTPPDARHVMETTAPWPGNCSALCDASEVQPGGRLSPNTGEVPDPD